MLKTIKSFFIVDVLEAMSYKLTPTEYSNRKDAEAAFEELRELYPDSRIREQQTIYDLTDPEDLRRYEEHLKRLR